MGGKIVKKKGKEKCGDGKKTMKDYARAKQTKTKKKSND